MDSQAADEAESGPSMRLELPAPALPEPSTWAQLKGLLEVVF